jgi:hypothetical protein
MSLARTSQSAVSRAPVTPSTPQTPAAQADQPYTPGGSWKHPKFDEIARRQHATTFDERNVRSIVANASLLFLSVYGNSLTSNIKLLQYAAYMLRFSFNCLANTCPARQSPPSSAPSPTATGPSSSSASPSPSTSSPRSSPSCAAIIQTTSSTYP